MKAGGKNRAVRRARTAKGRRISKSSGAISIVD
jgi:hypothetical protein